MQPSITLEQLAAYLEKPDTQRPFARYREDLLEATPAFTPTEVERLIEIVRLDTPNYPKFSVSKLLIDLSWASSHLEGNTYTQLDTQVLIEYGQKNKDKPLADAAMIINHKKAIEWMLHHTAITEDNIKNIHKALADNQLAPDSRHFLAPQRCGTVRSYTEFGLTIHGSSYLPPQAEDRPAGYIAREFTRLLASANALPDAINQSFFLFTRIPYLQVFYDGNKRTSRIGCNMPLIRHALAPLSFVDCDKKKYMAGLLAFYELGDERLARNTWLDAYLASALRYLPLEEKARVALAMHPEKQVNHARRYVEQGILPDDGAWFLRAKDDDVPKHCAAACRTFR